MYHTRSELSWQLFSDRQMNKFIVHFLIMQNAGYKHFGFSTILHCLKDLCKKNNLAYKTMHTEPPIVPSAHFTVWFLGHHRLCIKETKGLDIWHIAPMKAKP